MTEAPANSSTCLLLTATIQVKEDLVLTARKDTNTRLNDYKQALSRWLTHPNVRALVLVENSGSDLSALREIAGRVPEKKVEFVSFTAPAFAGSLGKGYGEMICLEHAMQHSKLLAESSQFIIVTGRYSLSNATSFLRNVRRRRDADVLCDMLQNLTWADSRVFAGTPEFLRTCLFPLREEVNDSRASNFEHVLARAAWRLAVSGPGYPFRLKSRASPAVRTGAGR